MKKFFTLIAMACLAIGANAQRINFTELKEVYEKDGFKVERTDPKGKNSIDTEKSDKFGTADAFEAITGVLKAGGKSSATENFLTLTIPTDATLKVYVRTASSNATDRNLVITQGETELYNKVVQEADKVETSDGKIYPIISVNVKAGTVLVNYPVGALNFYAFELSTGGDEPSGAEVWDASTADLETIAANPVDNANPNFFSVAKEKKIYPTGTFEAGSADVVASDGTPITLKNYILTAETASIKMTAISTPNSDASANQGWQLKANGGNAGLNTDDCVVKFEKAIAPKNGNPSMGYKEYYEAKSDGGEAFRVQDVYWTPETKQMPLKGLYYEFETKAAGELLIGIRMNRETDQLYVFTKDDFAQLPTSALSIEGFVNNNTIVVGTNEKAMFTITMTADHNYSHGVADKTEDYIEGFPTSKAVFGYLKLNVEANKTYVMLSPKAQPAIFGFQFTGTTGIETVKTQKAFSADAPMYNMAGQKVDKSYKGIVIQNGRKFYNK